MATRKQPKKQAKQEQPQDRINISLDDIQTVCVLADTLESGGNEAFDSLAGNLLDLDGELKQGNVLWVRDWIDTMIDQCFLRSKAYTLAKQIYRSMHELDGGKSPEEVLQGVIDSHITAEKQTEVQQ